MDIPLRRALMSLALLALPGNAEDAVAKKEKGPYGALEYRLVGPFIGGRVSRAVGVSGDPLVYYAATASSGGSSATCVGSTSDSGSPTDCSTDWSSMRTRSGCAG